MYSTPSSSETTSSIVKILPSLVDDEETRPNCQQRNYHRLSFSMNIVFIYAMKDCFGHQRGSCRKCKKCDEFISAEGEIRCTRCGCTPVDHEKVGNATVMPDRTRSMPVDHSEREDRNGSIMGDSSVGHLGGATKNIERSPLCAGNNLEIPLCRHQCCQNVVEFDINTGKNFNFCSDHSLKNENVIQNDELDLSVSSEKEESVVSKSSERPTTLVCRQSNCHELVEFDLNTGREFSFCSYHNLMRDENEDHQDDKSNHECAIKECKNERFVDDEGVVHDCCCYTHAMEHHRRKSLQTQGINQDIVKGITHCLLPECDNFTWPFENYCGKTHASIGMTRGLYVQQLLDSDGSSYENRCIYPNCTKERYVEQNGVTHPYCGKTHANLAKSLGIFLIASSPDDQCELEGCNVQKRREGKRLHDYCCIEHAKKDEPNRTILTSLADVTEFLKQFPKLTVVSLDENEHAKKDGDLYKKFRDKARSLPKDQRKTCLAFHGTAAVNIPNICQNGYDPAKRKGQAYGAGEYFAKNPTTSMSYCKGGKKMLLNELLLGKEGVHHTKHGDIIVMKEPVHDLPRFVITYQ